MKQIITLIAFSLITFVCCAQTTVKYPVPEFSNEIYFFNKDAAHLTRLEKGLSKMESKTKMGGMGGGETGYSLDGTHSPNRIAVKTPMDFVYYTGDGSAPNASADSIMKANGMDPRMASSDPMAAMNDPSRTTSLYNMNADKEKRRVILQSYSGMKILGHNKKASDKYTFSIHKVREGYYEFQVDKPLPKGEYAFMVNSMVSADGSALLFAFGVD